MLEKPSCFSQGSERVPITRSNTKWPPCGFIIVGKVNLRSAGSVSSFLKLQSVKGQKVIWLIILCILEGVKGKWSTNGRGPYSSENCLRYRSRVEAWLAEQVVLCSASWEQEIQSQRSKRLIPSNAILMHTYTSLGIYFGKTIPIVSYPPRLSSSTPIWETSI